MVLTSLVSRRVDGLVPPAEAVEETCPKGRNQWFVDGVLMVFLMSFNCVFPMFWFSLDCI